MKKHQMLELDPNALEATSKTQVRVRLDPAVIDAYALAMKDGAVFPPVIAFAEDGSERYILADGFHRRLAAIKIAKSTLTTEVRLGGLKDALHFALAANEDHGVRRSNADKTRAVNMALDEPEYAGLSLRDIGEICRVSHQLVRNIKAERNAEDDDDKGKVNDPQGPDNKEPANGNERASKERPDQNQIDLDLVMTAVDTFRSLPYDGTEVMEKMALTAEHYSKMFYLAEWVDNAVHAMETAGLAGGEDNGT